MNDPKSPRDWLLSRHTTATPQLDTLRRAALPEPPLSFREVLGEIFRPHRNAWRALAAVWVALLAFHFATHRPALAPTLTPEAAITQLKLLTSHATLAQTFR